VVDFGFDLLGGCDLAARRLLVARERTHHLSRRRRYRHVPAFGPVRGTVTATAGSFPAP
jgi:hypothetical protein